jgi:SH3 domain-containing protein
MALIRCYECGKEISSLATACPSCGAPPRPTIVPPPLPTQARPASRAKQLSWGTIALLTGVVLVLVIRGVTHQPSTPSVAASPTPATAESATTSSPPVETASQSSPSPTATETQTAESATTSSPPVDTASQSSPNPTATETQTAESATTSSPPVETASQSSPSPTAAETPYASDASVTTTPPPRATYQVIGIPPGDYLNVREGAGSDYQVVTKLEPGAGGILLGTKRVANGATTWQEITVHGQTGWVNAAYIALETQVPTSPTESSTAP